jgi:methionyl-tRNA synthetase
MKTNTSHPVVAFYTALAAVIGDETFVESSAQALEKQFSEIMPRREDMTMKFFREAYDEYHDNAQDLDLMEQLAEQAFEDLAPHMHDVNARKAFRRLAEMSGTYEIQDLYSHVSNVRFLGKDKDGMAVVTLVVNSYRELQNLLKNPRDGAVEVGHLSVSV